MTGTPQGAASTPTAAETLAMMFQSMDVVGGGTTPTAW